MRKERIRARAQAIVDSRGRPTVLVTLSCGSIESRAAVPSGKSTGSHEAVELRDADGVGVSTAIRNVTGPIQDALEGSPLDLAEIDRRMIERDGTPNKRVLGANAMLGVSMAAARLIARAEGVPLWRSLSRIAKTTPGFPLLYMNMLNGGAHADFALPFQEYIVAVGGKGPHAAYTRAKRIFARLGHALSNRFGEVAIGDEGGFAPRMDDLDAPFELLREAIGPDDAFLAIDAAASEFSKDGSYEIGGVERSRDEMLGLYERLTLLHGVRSIEDPFHESDFLGFEAMVADAGSRILVVGDDLTTTNPREVEKAIAKKRANAMIVKPNQVGTVTETLETVRIARAAGWKLIVSHRSGETMDPFVADLAVAVGAFGIKAGAPTQKERRAKYERLLAIEDEFWTAS